MRKHHPPVCTIHLSPCQDKWTYIISNMGIGPLNSKFDSRDIFINNTSFLVPRFRCTLRADRGSPCPAVGCGSLVSRDPAGRDRSLRG